MKVGDLFAALSLRPNKKSFDAADKMLGHVRNAVIGLGAIQGVRWFKGLIDQTVELGSKLVDTSERTGATVEELQQIGFAADKSGSSFEGAANGLGALARTMDTANRGGKKQRAVFREMGIAYRDANGELRPTGDVLGDIADRFQSMANGPAKQGLARLLFKGSGNELIPLLNQGSSGIAKMRQEFVDLGGQIDGETAESLEAFGDEQHDLQVAWQGLRNEAVKALLPALRELVTGFTAWVKANRKLLAQRLATVFKLMVGALKIFAKVLGVVLDLLGFLVDNLEAVAVAVGALVVALMILRARSIAAAVASAVAWAAAALPILLLAAVIAGAILLFEDLYQAFTGGESVLKDLWEEGLDGLLKRLSAFVDKAKGALMDLANEITEILGLGEEKKKIAKGIVGIVGAVKNAQDDKKLRGKLSEWGVDAKDGKAIGAELDRRFEQSPGALNAELTAAGLSATGVRDIISARVSRRDAKRARQGQEDAAFTALTGGPTPDANMSRAGAQTVDLSNMSIQVTTTSSDPVIAGEQTRKAVNEALNDKIREAISW